MKTRILLTAVLLPTALAGSRSPVPSLDDMRKDFSTPNPKTA